ncbi:hypothetical protein ACN27G_19650 [Plantactinospora sp. WMMB334]|uniref:hypothetical protein n=1 Tax=Plantactinospora sp. WMMB334 TaxID=3404119 RepID=UPI003B937C09
MRYGRKQRREQKKERPFARRLKYESAKEGLGKLVEWGSAGIGMMLGVAATRLGLPISPAVATTGGAILGGLLGSQGKAYIVARLDYLRETRAQRKPQAAAEATTTDEGGDKVPAKPRGDPPKPPPKPFTVGAFRRAARVPHRKIVRGRTDSSSVASQVISGLEKAIDQLEQAAKQAQQLGVDVWASHNRLSATLAGGRPEVVRHTHDRLTTARHHVQDSVNLLRQAAERLREYRSAI